MRYRSGKSLVTTDPIKRFTARVKSASVARGTEVRIPISEATELCAAITEILLAMVENNTKAEETVEIKFDGGGF